jgi:nitrogen regulation protein NR(I)
LPKQEIMSRILVVDDEANVLLAFEEILGELGHEVITARRAEAALECLQSESFDLVILDIRLPGMDGLEALRRIRAARDSLPVIVMTGQGTMETAVEATKRGAFDYHLKPFDPAEMLRTVDRALASVQLMRGHVTLGREPAAAAGDTIIGHSPAMQEVFKTIGRVAQTAATVLINGESGTGKELVARAVYCHSDRSRAPLMVVNCVAIPETLLESELFGHEKGAYTGAVARRIGKFEQADGGTLFLDEIGDIPLGIQGKILRVLQEKSFQRLGSNETVTSDVRVLAATNRDLEKAVREGAFREDLYHRLNVVRIHVPALRERPEDITELVDYFLERFARELATHKPPLAAEAMDALRRYSWPGNVRELEHCLYRAMIFTRGHSIQAADLRLPEDQDAATTGRAASRGSLVELVEAHLDAHRGPGGWDALVEEVERLLLVDAMRRTHGNQSQAARLLGLARPTLHAKLQKYGLHAMNQDGRE